MPFDDERENYSTIKARVLEAYFDFCRDSGLIDRWSHRQILGRVDYEYENIFKRPIENLMLAVVQLVLQGGWYPEAEQHIRKTIADKIAQHGLDNLLADVPEDEADLFRHDLHILKLI